MCIQGPKISIKVPINMGTNNVRMFSWKILILGTLVIIISEIYIKLNKERLRYLTCGSTAKNREYKYKSNNMQDKPNV